MPIIPQKNYLRNNYRVVKKLRFRYYRGEIGRHFENRGYHSRIQIRIPHICRIIDSSKNRGEIYSDLGNRGYHIREFKLEFRTFAELLTRREIAEKLTGIWKIAVIIFANLQKNNRLVKNH